MGRTDEDKPTKKSSKKIKKGKAVTIREIRIKKVVGIDEIEAALRKTGGFLSYTAEELKMPLTDLKYYMRKYKRLREIHNEVREGTVELAESELVKKVRSGNLLAIMFFLKCQGQDRGWIDKPMVTQNVKEEKPLLIRILPPEGYTPPKQLKAGRPKLNKPQDFIDAETLDD